MQEPLDTKSLWVFGYGSLCWHPGFQYDSSLIGFVKGFARRFWQGNSHHRGTPQKPGRVVTLIEKEDETTWGRAYKLCGEEALNYLNNREVTLGSYHSYMAEFHPKDNSEPFHCLVYVASPQNNEYLGPASVYDIACQILDSRGVCGHNVEYLLKLADFMREHIPESSDTHLFTLEMLIKYMIRERNLCPSSFFPEKSESGASQTLVPVNKPPRRRWSSSQDYRTEPRCVKA